LPGEKLKKLEAEKGIVIRFMIGHSPTSDSALDKAIDVENAIHDDFLRLVGDVLQTLNCIIHFTFLLNDKRKIFLPN
jgi:hypothetical protein